MFRNKGYKNLILNILYMPYTYDNSLFTKGHMMLGSSKIRTLDSISDNFKKLTCSVTSDNPYSTGRYYIGGIPMYVDKMNNGRSALRIIDINAISGLNGTFENIVSTTCLNGCSIQVVTNGENDYIMHIQRLTDISSTPVNNFTDYSGMQWILDEDDSLAITITTQQPKAFKKFMFGNKMLLCGEYDDGFSPIALIDKEYNIVTSGLVVNLDPGDTASYPGSGNKLYDLSGNNRTVTLYNSPSFSSTNGGILNFTKSSLQYGLSDSNLPDLNRWTAEVWVKFKTIPNASNVTTVITGEYDGLSKLNFSLGTNLQPTNANIYAGFFNGAWRNTSSGYTPNTTSWIHLVGTYNGSTITLYVNTSSFATGSITASPQSGGKLRICRRWDDVATNSNYFLDAYIGSIKIYDRALTSAEILQNYNAYSSNYI
jgi:hypothetical protein